jgi:hypothetical protein
MKSQVELFKSCRGENSIMVNENVVSHFTSRAYDSINDLEETIKNPANCCSSTVKHSIKTILAMLTLNPYTFTKILTYQF